MKYWGILDQLWCILDDITLKTCFNSILHDFSTRVHFSSFITSCEYFKKTIACLESDYFTFILIIYGFLVWNLSDLSFFVLFFSREAKSEQISVIFDMKDTGWNNMDMDFIRYLITLLKSYYPYFVNFLMIYEMPWLLKCTYTETTQNIYRKSHFLFLLRKWVLLKIFIHFWIWVLLSLGPFVLFSVLFSCLEYYQRMASSQIRRSSKILR